MRKAQREIYQVLANERDLAICCFCQFSRCESGISPCDCGEPYCTHPLLDKSFSFEQQEENAANLGDCWGFRPTHDVSFCADVIGIIMAKNWDSAVWWEGKQGKWHIAGIKP